MKKIIAILMALCLTFALCACGGGSIADQDPNLGKYIGIQGEMSGFVMTMEELFPGESYLELEAGGKGALVLEGDSMKVKWTREGENLDITVDGESCPSTVKDGVIVMDFAGSGIILTFAKEGASLAEEAPEQAAATNAGFYHLYGLDQDGEYTDYDTLVMAGLEDMCYVDIHEDGTGIVCMDGDEIPGTFDANTFTDDEGGIVEFAIVDGVMEMYLEGNMTFYFKLGEPESAPSGEDTQQEAAAESAGSDGIYGLYQGTTYEAAGQTFDMTEIYEGLSTVELYEDGTCQFNLGGEVMDCTWSLDGEEFVLSNNGLESPGSLKDGVMCFDFMEMGMLMTFEKSGAEAPESEAAEEDYEMLSFYMLDSMESEGEMLSSEDLAYIEGAEDTCILFWDDETASVNLFGEELLLYWDDTSLYDENGSANYAIEEDVLVLDMGDGTYLYFIEME